MRLGRIILYLCAVVLTQTLFAQDVTKVAPSHAKVLLENDEVRTIEFFAKKGEMTPMHSHPAHLIYPLSDGKTRFTYPDGTTKVLNIKKGVPQWVGPVTHAHLALTDNHVLTVEVKKPPAKKK
jgi:quercetin dioxygenase-like cupin family protein